MSIPILHDNLQRLYAGQPGATQARLDALESFVIGSLVSRERLCWKTEEWATGFGDFLHATLNASSGAHAGGEGLGSGSGSGGGGGAAAGQCGGGAGADGKCTPKPKRKRVVVASVPRSGNGWLRTIFAALDGRTTLSRPDEPRPMRERIATPKECGREFRADREFPGFVWLVGKSHYPFDTTMNCGCKEPVRDTTCVVRLVRNPLDNYDAWVRYISNTTIHGPRRPDASQPPDLPGEWFLRVCPSPECCPPVPSAAIQL